MNAPDRVDQFEGRLAAALDDFVREVRFWIIFFGILNSALLIVGIVVV